MTSPETFNALVEGRLVKLFDTVCSIAVMANGHLLMGQRRDTGKWTLPGGHCNPKEVPLVGAFRELREETGLVAPSLKGLGYAVVNGRTGRPVCIYAYRWDTHLQPTHTANDPDEEVHSWEWIDIRQGLPREIRDNLHSPKNLVLQKLGLL